MMDKIEWKHYQAQREKQRHQEEDAMRQYREELKRQGHKAILINKKGGNNMGRLWESHGYFKLLVISPKRLGRGEAKRAEDCMETPSKVEKVEILPNQYFEIKTRLQLLMHKDLIEEFQSKAFIKGLERK